LDANATPEPDRKRSLEDESDEEGRSRGRYKRIAGEPLVPGDVPVPIAVSFEGAIAVTPVEDMSGVPAVKSVTMRALVTGKEAGIIIGKGGRNVVEIRDQSGAKITVSEQVPGAQERIVTISGPLDAVAKAFSLVARKCVEERQNDVVDIPQRQATISVLVPHTRMGSVIGKSGSKIKEIQEASGARCFASEELLAGSTERTVTITGVIDSIHIASYHIGAVLQEHPERAIGCIPYKPQMRMPGAPAHGAAHGMGAGNRAQMPYYNGGPPGMPPMHNGHPGHPGHAGHPMGPGMPMMPQHGVGMATAIGMQIQQIYIPNEMVGAIIGKAGCRINEIRQQSGCQIKIGETPQGGAERLITITGSPDGNQAALFLLYSRLEAEKVRLSGGGGPR